MRVIAWSRRPTTVVNFFFAFFNCHILANVYLVCTVFTQIFFWNLHVSTICLWSPPLLVVLPPRCAEAKRSGIKQNANAEEAASIAKLQIGASRNAIDDARADGWSLVTDIRVEADAREAERRRDEGAWWSDGSTNK